MFRKILFLLLPFFSLFAFSQTIGIGVSYPTGNFRHGVNFGYNAGVGIEVPIGGFHGMGYVAYGLWDEKTVTDEEHDVITDADYQTPFALIGARKYFGGFYVSMLAGIYFIDLHIKENRSGEIYEYDDNKTQGSLAPGVGYRIPFKPVSFDLGLNYLWNEDFGQIWLTTAIVL